MMRPARAEEIARAQEISTANAERVIGAERVERTIVEPSVDSQGEEALRVVVVLKPKVGQRITGDQAIDLLVAIRHALSEEGDDRFPLIQYATEEELREQQAWERGENQNEED